MTSSPKQENVQGNNPYEPVTMCEDTQHEEKNEEIEANPPRSGAIRIIPSAVRRLLNSTSLSTDRRSELVGEIYESHVTPTNCVTDVADGVPLNLDMEKESYHRKSVATSIAGSTKNQPQSSKRPETTPFAIPRVTLQETQRYTFAIILRNNQQVEKLYKQRLKEATTDVQRANLSPADLTAHVAALQQKALRRLVQAGLGVILLDNDTYINDDKDSQHAQTNNICILVDPYKNKGLLHLEFMREKDELAIGQGNATARLGEARLPISGSKDICFSPALELQLTHNIIRNAFRDYDQDVCDIDRNCVPTVMDVVHSMFPLHDKKFNNVFFKEYRRHTFKLKWGKTVAGNAERWAIEELRLHFGERVAFLFAFMHIYTKALLPVMVTLCVFYLSLRFGNQTWDTYMFGLAIMGFLITSVWAPVLLHLWNRETLILAEKWNLGGYKQTVFESNDENPYYEYTWEQNSLTNQYEKQPKTRKLAAMRATMGFFVLLSCLVQCVCMLPFIQWYVYAKTVPTCEVCRQNKPKASQTIFDCVAFLTCFNAESSVVGTDRWVYILAQGIVLGLMIDVVFFEFFRWLSIKFVHWENCAKKSHFEAKLIHRSFVFVWANWFFWFLFLAFVYLPYGDVINRELKKFCESNGIKIDWVWDPSILSLDQLFVTPLVATQFLNMMLETWVPYMMKKYRGRPFSVRYWFNTWSCTIKREKMTIAKRIANNKSARQLAKDVSSTTRFFVPVLERSDDDNQHTAYEIVAESTLPEFDTQLDYLDAAIQFSYVVMFSIVWPLLPIPAFINNILEVRGDAFRLLFCHRRPMPRRDVSIGEWATVLQYANIIGITVVCVFIVMYHGIAYIHSSCNFDFSKADMVPLFTVKYSSAVNPEKCRQRLKDPSPDESPIHMIQVVAFIVLEHLAFIVRYLVTQGNKIPSSIGNPNYLRLKQLRELTSKRSALVEQFEYMKQLRLIFDKYDRDKIDHLYEEELALFLAEWVGTERSKLNSSILFRYMDKTRLGKVPFSTCCLMLRHAEFDRFFSVLLGTCDSLDNFRNDGMRLSITDDGLGAHARHLSRFRSLSDSTPRNSAYEYDNQSISSRESDALTTPPASASLVRQRVYEDKLFRWVQIFICKFELLEQRHQSKINAVTTFDQLNLWSRKMWEWRIFGLLNETTQELLDTLAVTLGALKVSQVMLPERRSDIYIVLPMPNVGIKFRNMNASSPNLEIKCAKEIEGTCGAQRWLKKRVAIPADLPIDDDEIVKQAIVGSGVEELEQVEIKFPLQRLRLDKERRQWKLALASNSVKIEITTLSYAINDGSPQKEIYFTIGVESKSVDAIAECLVKLAIGEIFELHVLQNIYVVEAIHIKQPNGKSAPPSSPSKSSSDFLTTMVPPTSGSSSGQTGGSPPLSPLKRKIATEGSRLRLIEMGYPAFACNILQASIARLGKEIH